MKRQFDKWLARSKTPKQPDGRTTRHWGHEDHMDYEYAKRLENAFNAGFRAGRAHTERLSK